MRKSVFLGLFIFCLAVRGADVSEPQPYTRIANPGTNTVQLQIALRRFVSEDNHGPTIWLAGVMHIGEPSYYSALQKFLETQTLVLYEGINPDAHPHHVHENDTAPVPADTNADSSMQSNLARSLGLVFQLDAIDYDRTNFLNSDLSVRQIQGIMAEGEQPAAPGEKAATNASFDILLQIMDGKSFLGSLFKMGLQFIESSPKFQSIAKLCLIEAIGKLKGDFSEVQGLPPDWKKLIKVLLEARNENLVHDLKTELSKIPDNGSIAVFYGAAHMDDLQKRLTAQLHYRAADETWLPAFSVDTTQSGISPAEAEWMKNLIDRQMDQMLRH